MSLRTLLLLVLLVCSSASAQLGPGKPPAAPETAFREAQWEELVPKGWDPYAQFRDANVGSLSDSNPRVLQMMRDLRQALDSAPTVAALDGAAVKLPGYVVPLEEVKGELKEFLLVPYFGACIHTPPPPANQIVHVVMDKPVKGIRSMEAVWASGTVTTARRDSAMGTSGYRMDGVIVESYRSPARR